MRLANFSHLVDGNLNYNVPAPQTGDAAAFLREREHEINTIVCDAVAAHGGSISSEHGVGELKRDELPRYKDATPLALMRAVKAALDPHIMNQGRRCCNACGARSTAACSRRAPAAVDRLPPLVASVYLATTKDAGSACR